MRSRNDSQIAVAWLEVGADAGVAGDEGRPAVAEQGDLAGVSLAGFGGGLRVAAGYGFAMGQFRVGDEEVLKAGSPHAQAEIDIVEVHGEGFVETADGFEDFPAHQQTGTRDGQIIRNRAETVGIAEGVALGVLEGVGGERAAADDHSRMLHRAVGVEQPRADAADRPPLGVLEHRPQPVRLDHLDVVVEKKDVWTADGAGAQVDQPAEVEGPIVPQDGEAAFMAGGAGAEQLDGSRLPAAVVHDQHFEIRVIGPFEYRPQASIEQLWFVASGNDDADAAGFAHGIADGIAAGRLRMGFDGAGFAAPGQGIFESPDAGPGRVGLGVHRPRGGFVVPAPVVKHAADVLNAFGPLRQAAAPRSKSCSALEAFAKSAYFMEQFRPRRQKMTNIVPCEQRIRAPLRLEVRLAKPAGFVDLVFVRVEQIEIGAAVLKAATATWKRASGVNRSS